MSTPTSLPPDIGKITEPLLLGLLLQWTLFGVLSVQVYIYYLAFPNDPLQRKFLVYTVYIAEVVQAILLARLGYIQFGAGFGNFDAINAIPVILWFGVPVLNSIVATVVQIFYAYRIRLLGNSYFIPSVVVLLAFSQLGGGIALGILTGMNPFFSKVSNKETRIAATISYGSGVICDVLIAVYMTYLLSLRKSDFKQTQRLIQKIAPLTIGTGMLTAAVAIVNLLLFLTLSKTTYYGTTFPVLGKLYSTTMMVLLNSRMVYGVKNDTPSNEISSVPTVQRSALLPSHHVGVSVMQEQF